MEIFWENGKIIFANFCARGTVNDVIFIGNFLGLFCVLVCIIW